MRAENWQQAFATALLDPASAEPDGLMVGAGIDRRRRFSVHRNNATLALVDALAAAFPVTQTLVGKDFFQAMARERLRIEPPRSPILVDYGEGFADFIAGFAPAAGLAYLADVARLERLRVRAFHAADALPVSHDTYRLLLVAPERLAATRVALHPACHWLHSSHAVVSIWSAHQGVDGLAGVELDAVDVDAAQSALVARPQLDVQVATLPEGGVAFLDALREGSTLGAAMACARRVASEVALETLLALIVTHGLAVSLEPPKE